MLVVGVGVGVTCAKGGSIVPEKTTGPFPPPPPPLDVDAEAQVDGAVTVTVVPFAIPASGFIFAVELSGLQTYEWPVLFVMPVTANCRRLLEVRLTTLSVLNTKSTLEVFIVKDSNWEPEFNVNVVPSGKVRVVSSATVTVAAKTLNGSINMLKPKDKDIIGSFINFLSYWISEYFHKRLFPPSRLRQCLHFFQKQQG